MDLGECSKIHDLALRADYEIASKERDLFFELDVSALSKYILQGYTHFVQGLMDGTGIAYSTYYLLHGHLLKLYCKYVN